MITHEALWFLLAPNWWTATVCAVVATVYYYQDGDIDAQHFSRLPNPKDNVVPDIHHDFLWQRSCVWIIMAFAAGVPLVLGSILTFPYVHDGAYYLMRNLINPNAYTDGWKSEPSKTSTARNDFSYRTRSLMAAAGLIIILTVVYLTTNYPTFRR